MLLLPYPRSLPRPRRDGYGNPSGHPFGLRLVNKSFRYFPQFDGLADASKIKTEHVRFLVAERPLAEVFQQLYF